MVSISALCKVLTLSTVLVAVLNVHAAAAYVQFGNSFPNGIQLGGELQAECNESLYGALRFADGEGVEVCMSGSWSPVSSISAEAVSDTLSKVLNDTTELKESVATLQSLVRDILIQVQGGNRTDGQLAPRVLQNSIYCTGNGVYDIETGSCTCYSDPVLGYYAGTGCQRCAEGWREDGNAFCVVDVNECEESLHNCDNDFGRCINTPGSFQCECNTGFTGSGEVGTCVDNDECSEGGHNCEDWETCTNTPGSFLCEDIFEVTQVSGSGGNIGDTITLHGRGFRPGANISFNGESIATTFVSSQEVSFSITGVVPIDFLQTYSSPQSTQYVVPPEYSEALLEISVIGGGAGGGSGESSWAGGGGGGGYSASGEIVLGGSIFDIVVGSQGNGATTCTTGVNSCGGDGGLSSVIGVGVNITSGGGRGGCAHSANMPASAGLGGYGSHTSGQDGSTTNGDNNGYGGNGGGLAYGFGGQGGAGVPNFTPGNHASAYGGGGGGGPSCQQGHRGGGNGAVGYVQIRRTRPGTLTRGGDSLSHPINIAIFRATTTETFATPGQFQWVAPADVKEVNVLLWGGGGGGGAGGGGGGGFSISALTPVTPGSSYTLVVGSGGSPQTACSNTVGNCGQDGGTSQIDFGGSVGVVTAGGGAGNGANNVPECTGAGGSGATEDGSGGGNADGSGQGYGGNAGGLSYGGATGAPGVNNFTPGNHGSAPGAGGSGGPSCQNGHRGGGRGGDGRIVLTY